MSVGLARMCPEFPEEPVGYVDFTPAPPATERAVPGNESPNVVRWRVWRHLRFLGDQVSQGGKIPPGTYARTRTPVALGATDEAGDPVTSTDKLSCAGWTRDDADSNDRGG